jgi:phosphoribosylformylglycinamidine synthase subunit PurL
VRGLGDAVRALETAVVGGNVSLYNEGAAGPIYPTPVIGMVGRLPDARRAGRLGFASAGDAVALVGPFAPSLAASELAKQRGEPLPDGLPEVDVAVVRAALEAVRDSVRAGALTSCHDVAEGGLLVAVAESCLAGGIGASLALDPPVGEEMRAWLFGEAPGGFVVSGPCEALDGLGERTPVTALGEVGGDALTVVSVEPFSIPLAELRLAHRELERFFP